MSLNRTCDSKCWLKHMLFAGVDDGERVAMTGWPRVQQNQKIVNCSHHSVKGRWSL